MGPGKGVRGRNGIKWGIGMRPDKGVRGWNAVAVNK